MAGAFNDIRNKIEGFSRRAADTGSTATDFTPSHSVLEGTVTKVDYDARLCTVSLGNEVLTNCVYLPGAMAGLVGVSVDTLPPAGTPVVVLRGRDQNYIVSGQQQSTQETPDTTNILRGDPKVDIRKIKKFQWSRAAGQVERSTGMYAPQDSMPGEYGLSNSMGIALRALHNFASISAGDAAKVETHLLNDMVRIICNYYVQHTACGDKLIWSDGGCGNIEEHFTGHQYEADGMDEPGSRPIATPYGLENVYETESPCVPDPYDDTGKWRLSRFTGHLGDMIHTFVTLPTKYVTTYNESAKRMGQFRAHVGMDGSVEVQAHGGVHIQVTPHIPIPKIHHKWDHPDVDGMFKEFSDKYHQLWDAETWNDLEYACWKMRRYLRYMTQYHSLQRFLSADKYCSFDEDSSYVANASGGDKPGADVSYGTLRSASITVDPSGSITLQSNQHGSIIMNQGNIQIAAAGNLELQAGGTLSIQGRNIAMLSASDMEIVSMAGKLVLKARTAWKALCEKGIMWLKSDAQEGDDTYETEVAEVKSKSEYVNHAIVLDAPKDKILIAGKRDVTIGSESENVRLQAEKGSLLMTGGELKAIVNGLVRIKASAAAIKARVVTFASRMMQLGTKVQISTSDNPRSAGTAVVEVDGAIRTRVMEGIGAVIGPENQNGRLSQCSPDSTIDIVPGSGFDALDEMKKADVYTGYQELELAHDVYSLRKWDDVVSVDIKHSESLKASLVYDYIINHEMPLMVEVSEDYTYLQESKRTQKSPVWPGTQRKSALMVYHGDDLPLDRAGGKKPSEYEPDLSPLVAEEYKYYVRLPQRPYPFEPTPVDAEPSSTINYYESESN